MKFRLGLAIVLVSCFLLTLAVKKQLTFFHSSLPVLKIDYPTDPIKIAGWAPVLSKNDAEIAMIQALYSPLLEIDNNEQLKSGWAESFVWQDKRTMILKLRLDHKRADGQSITATDAAHSLKRMAFLEQNEDAFYVEQFCHIGRLNLMSEPCPGLSADKQTLTIQTRDPVSILPKLLTEVDSSIVPQDALEPDGFTLKDRAMGSGPYYIDRIEPTRVYFKANPHHFNFHSKMPQLITLIASFQATPQLLFEKFMKNEIDHAPRFSALNAFEFFELAEKLEGVIHRQSTLPIGIGLLLFSETGRERLSTGERQQLVLRFQKATTDCLQSVGQSRVRQPTKMLVPATGAGVLNADEEAELEIARQNLLGRFDKGPVALRLPSYIRDQIGNCLLSQLQDLALRFTDPGDDSYDLRFKSYDLSNYEELGSIRSMLNSGLLDSAGLSVEAWIGQYISEQDDQKRMNLLKRSHLGAIWENPTVIPLWKYETGALIRKPWVMNFSPLSSLNPLHSIRYAE